MASPHSARHTEYWWWFVGAIVLLIPLDLVTTMFAIAQYGFEGETNPFMRLLLQSEWHIVLTVNLGLAFLTIGFFYGIMEMGKMTPDHLKSKYYLIFEVWMGSIISIGLAVLVNNIAVLTLGESLL